MATPREQLADLLKSARIDAGYDSQGALANKMRVSRPVVSKAENPTQPIPSLLILTGWSGATGMALDRLVELAERCRSGTPEWFMPYMAVEAVATLPRIWMPLVVPGLLQAESYARALLSVEPYSREQLEELVRARMERQQVLDRAYVTAIIDNRVLRECVGSAAIMAEQCAYLLTLAERPNISLHVVPQGTNVGTWGGLDIATGADGGTVVCLNAFEDVTSTSPQLTGSAVRSFERILGTALPTAPSLDFVREMEESWKSQM